MVCKGKEKEISSWSREISSVGKEKKEKKEEKRRRGRRLAVSSSVH